MHNIEDQSAPRLDTWLLEIEKNKVLRRANAAKAKTPELKKDREAAIGTAKGAEAKAIEQAKRVGKYILEASAERDAWRGKAVAMKGRNKNC